MIFIGYLTFLASPDIDIHILTSYQGNLFLSMNRPEAAVVAFRGAQELRPDLRSYQGIFS